jgi:hypothetical protein
MSREPQVFHRYEEWINAALKLGYVGPHVLANGHGAQFLHHEGGTAAIWNSHDIRGTVFPPNTATFSTITTDFAGALASLRRGSRVRRVAWPEGEFIKLNEQGEFQWKDYPASGMELSAVWGGCSEDLLATDWTLFQGEFE